MGCINNCLSIACCACGAGADLFDEDCYTHQLWYQRSVSNMELMKSSREDEESAELFKLTCDDARLGRMTWPVPVAELDTAHFRMVPRFAVQQGQRPDGSTKIRPVDNFSWSHCTGTKRRRSKKEAKETSINGHFVVKHELKHDHLDDLYGALKVFFELLHAVPGLWKADIANAFRHVPLKESQRWAAWVLFSHKDVQYASSHIGMPFGATSSVVAWHRIGHLLTLIARRVLFLPVLVYVDDFFSPERPVTMKHAMSVFARLVKLLLGPDAIASHKLECGCSLVILGMHVTPSREGVVFHLCQEKARKWCALIQEAIQRRLLEAGAAQKLAGRLNWAVQALFHRLGRAMLKAIYAQKCSQRGYVGDRLLVALEWWLNVLSLKISETRKWRASTDPVARLFVDAASTPARIAAVLCCNGEISYTDCAPSSSLVGQLSWRRDKQIMSLEIIAIMLALSTFSNKLKGRKVVLYSDNKGAEGSTVKGSSRAFDHNALIHHIWTKAVVDDVKLWVERVASELNIADLPSRFEYGLLKELGAKWVEPVMDELFLGPS